MNAYTLIIVFLFILCDALGNHPKYDNYPNVGTVLFSKSDLKKPQWTKFNIALLQARRYFQNVIPPPNFINGNQDYVDTLLNYFRDGYSSIKTEIHDPELDIIMTKALSDTIGGCLKQWILPVTKRAFYGGSITSENANKLVKFYNEIRKYLGTDGAGWNGPDPKMMSSIHVSVNRLPRITHNTKNDDPCQRFAYLESTVEGLTIPMPYIDWQAKTMFIPLKNYPLIALCSTKHSLALIKYYDAAKRCIESKNPNASAAFDKRFQAWLNFEVVPHLSDDTLYVALGSVLGLANKTQKVNNNIFDIYKIPHKETPYLCSCSTMCFSKKTVIIFIILLIEITWCIIALKHVCLKKDRKLSTCCSDIIMFFKARRNNWSKDPSNCKSKQIIKQYSGSWNDVRGGGIKLHQKPKRFDKQYDFGAQHPSTIILTKQTSTKSRETITVCSKKRMKQCVNVIDETSKSKPSKKSRGLSGLNPCEGPTQSASSNYITMQNPDCNCSGCPTCSSNNTDITNCTNTTMNTDATHTVSFLTIQETHPSKTVTLFKRSQRSIERAMCDSIENNLIIRKAISERTGLILDAKAKELAPSKSMCECVCCDTESICPCSSSQSIDQVDPNKEREQSLEICPGTESGQYSCESSITKTADTPAEQSKIIETFSNAETVIMCFDKSNKTETKNIQKATIIEMQKKFTITRNKQYSDKPFVEIKIDRPNTEICVGISAGQNPSRRTRTSKIPKKALPLTKEDKTSYHSDLPDKAFLINEQIISEAVKRYIKRGDREDSTRNDNDEVLRFDAKRKDYQESKMKTEKIVSKIKDPIILVSSCADIHTDPQDDTEHIANKSEKCKTRSTSKESKIPSKAKHNIAKKSLAKRNKDVDSNVNEAKESDVDSKSKSTKKAKVLNDDQGVDSVKIKKPHNIIYLFKKSALSASTPKPKQKSFIPQLKKNTTDDAGTVSKKATVKDSKLNITM